ncbi:MAG TPA: hypothetical protein VMS64_17230 [Candidatus Methylomirabilis sp.]|nr:hypothetical protein [Candidatus Methylomirabilis sp.]
MPSEQVREPNGFCRLLFAVARQRAQVKWLQSDAREELATSRSRLLTESRIKPVRVRELESLFVTRCDRHPALDAEVRKRGH